MNDYSASLENGSRALLFGLVGSILFFSLGCTRAAAPISVSNQPISINGRRTFKPLGEMSWTTNDGSVRKLADFKGKAVILDFWATYCGPCREEIPHLNSLIAKYGQDNLLIVGLNVGGQEDKIKIPQFVAVTPIDYEISFPENELNDFVFDQTSSIPQTLVFDRKGNLLTKVVGFSPKIQKELDAAVEMAVKPD
ncbi:MAG TPA: TlpA disulfide reductase family protein [Pyrinomonadaceae bacterium]|nr:TlpA disulfide reductase family protein [Pyrinomonadaceae bacterium]